MSSIGLCTNQLQMDQSPQNEPDPETVRSEHSSALQTRYGRLPELDYFYSRRN